MAKIFILDTYYGEFLAGLPRPINGTYETELRKVLDRRFGTFDAYSHYLKQEGWETCDVIANHQELQRRWAMEQGYTNVEGFERQALVLAQIDQFAPDVVFCQDLSFFDPFTLDYLRRKYLLAGQCSCPMPRTQNVSKFHLLFTSFPHYVDRFKSVGVNGQFLPLAFDPRVMQEESPKKQFDIAFVGGVGRRLHWKAGTDLLERIAAEFNERFIWFGYGRAGLDENSPLIPHYASTAWGRDLYSVYGRAKIVINRHGEVSEGNANNLRMFEATGMGALLLTEAYKNMDDYFSLSEAARYTSEDSAIQLLHYYLDHEDERREVALAGQKRTLSTHTYSQRMKIVSEVLTRQLTYA